MLPSPENKSVALACATRYETWYPGELKDILHTGKVRGDLALEFLNLASQEGYRVVFADSGSTQEFLEAVSIYDGVSLLTGLNVKRAEQKRAALIEASQIPKIKVIINTEAEKVGLISEVKKLTSPVLDKGVDVVIPSRQPDLFKESFPDYMYASEIIMNKILNDLLHIKGILPGTKYFDWFFGPRVIKNNSVITGWFLEEYQPNLMQNTSPLDLPALMPEETGSNPQFYGVYKGLLMAAWYPDQYKIEGVEIPFEYPHTQSRNESEDSLLESNLRRRSMQVYQFSVDCIEYLRFLQNDFNNRLVKIV